MGRLASFSKGVLITQIVSIESDTVNENQRTLVVKRPRLGETFDFPNSASSVNVLTGFGASGSQFDSATSMGGHSSSGSNAPELTFSKVCTPSPTVEREVDDPSNGYRAGPLVCALFALV